MFTSKTKVLLILTQDVLDRALVLARKATTALKLPVSLQLAEANIRLNTRLQQAEGAAYRDREPYSRSRADDASKDAVVVAQRVVEAVPGIRWDGIQEAAGQRYVMMTEVKSESSGWLALTAVTLARVRAWAAEARERFGGWDSRGVTSETVTLKSAGQR